MKTYYVHVYLVGFIHNVSNNIMVIFCDVARARVLLNANLDGYILYSNARIIAWKAQGVP